jgi:hypothetical protein
MSANVVAILGMIITLLLAYGLDYWVQSAKQTASQTFDMVPLMWGAGLANLLLAGAFLLLAWFVALRAKRNRYRAAIFIMSGLLSTFSAGIYFALPAVVLPFDPVPFLVSTSHLSLAGAFIAVLGLASLVQQR